MTLAFAGKVSRDRCRPGQVTIMTRQDDRGQSRQRLSTGLAARRRCCSTGSACWSPSRSPNPCWGSPRSRARSSCTRAVCPASSPPSNGPATSNGTGPGGFGWGSALLGSPGPCWPTSTCAGPPRPELEKLTQRTGETTALVIWNGHESVVVEEVQSPNQVKHTAPVGTRYDTHQSSSVQVFLLECPPDLTSAVRATPDRRPGRSADAVGISTSWRRHRRGYALNDGRTSLEEVGSPRRCTTTAVSSSPR